VPGARRVNITMPGLALHPPDPAADDPLIGESGDRHVAVMILRAGLQADDQAVATLQAAAAQTTSTRFRQAVGFQVDAIALRGIWAGTSVATAVGVAAAKLATEMSPRNASAWRSYGLLALSSTGRFEDALASYDQALALDPGGDATAHGGRGVTLQALGRFEEALAAYDRALALDPGNAITHSGRGVALVALGRFDDELAAFDQALALDPENTSSLHRGVALVALGRYEDALAAFDQALALDPDNGRTHESKGITLAVIGNFDQALAEFDTAGRLAPTGAGEGRAWAGAILWHRRDAAGARDQFALVKSRVTGCTPFRTAEMEALALCGLGQPDDVEKRLLDAMHLRAPGDRAGPRPIYDLLSDPPLPGIDRLRAIVDNDA